jgi:type I restriction enzyme S subunit
MAEQRAIVRDLDARVSNLAAPIARAQREIELVREFRNRLISDVVTGKLDVRCIELPDFEQGEEIFLSGDQSSVETPEEEEESVSESVEESTHAD